jgi:hypothetical protein
MAQKHPAIVTMRTWQKTLKAEGSTFDYQEEDDRTVVFKELDTLGLAHAEFLAFDGDKLKQKNLQEFVDKYKTPFWLSLVPKSPELGSRITILDLNSALEAKSKLSQITNLANYKVIIMQYCREADYKGTAILNNGSGIIEFAKGDNHQKLTQGVGTPDPMIISDYQIVKYSKNLPLIEQKAVFNFLGMNNGYFGFGKGIMGGKKKFFIFVYRKSSLYLNYFKNRS